MSRKSDDAMWGFRYVAASTPTEWTKRVYVTNPDAPAPLMAPAPFYVVPDRERAPVVPAELDMGED